MKFWDQFYYWLSQWLTCWLCQVRFLLDWLIGTTDFVESPVDGIECFHMFVLRWSVFWFKSSLRISFSCLSCKKKLALQRIHFTTLYIQSNLESILPKTNFGLYRNDELILLRNLNGQWIDKKKKTIIKIFKDIRFSIDIQTNLKEVDFLDGTPTKWYLSSIQET